MSVSGSTPRFAGKTAIVTGAARGIGFATARRFAAEGARTILIDLAASDGEASAAALRDAGLDARFLACDCTDKAAVDTAFAGIAASGGIDILHANAGILRGAEFVDVAEADWDEVIDVNLKSVFLCGQAAARAMIDRGKGGAIINTSSIANLLTASGGASYTASKSGVAGLTRAMALSLAPHGIRVNAIGPGTVATEMMAQPLANPHLAGIALSRTPLGRFATADDIAGTVAFLASDDAAYITAQTIYIEGGRLALNYINDAFAIAGRAAKEDTND